MLQVEENFIYQRKGLYEELLNKITEAEQKKSKEGNHDELKSRV